VNGVENLNKRPPKPTLFVQADRKNSMHWRLFATLAETAGQTEVDPGIEGSATLREAFDALLEAHPELEAEVLDEDEQLYEHVRLLVDGTDPFTDEGWTTTVDPDAELALFPPVSGG
jgi:molybdopterin synthase sulfur carrier subunit